MKKTTNDSNGQSHDHGAGGDGDGNIRGGGGAPSQNSTTYNAILSYLKLIKQTFPNQTEKYDMFLEFLKDFKAGRIGSGGLMERAEELFKGHRDLISGLNAFLPEGYDITLDEFGASPPKKAVKYDDALDLTHKIKKRFQNDDHVYLSFCDALRMFRYGSKDITEVYKEINSLKLDGGKAMIKERKKHTEQVEESRYRRVHDQNERNPDISYSRGLECKKKRKKSVKKAEAPRLTADFTCDNIDTLKGKPS